MCSWKLIVATIALALAIVGAILGWGVFPNVIRDQIKEVSEFILNFLAVFLNLIV